MPTTKTKTKTAKARARTRAATAAAAKPFRFFDLHVLRAARISPAMMRITFGGDVLRDLVSGGRDQRVKLFLPHPGQDAPVVPIEAAEKWYDRWREMDPSVRGIMRTYTVREQRREPEELDVDFAVHGDEGPASRWAARARPGDRVTLLGPVEADNGGVDFRPPPQTDWVLLTADETALPAVAGILAWLPPATTAKVWIEVGHAEDIQQLPTTADAEITWLVRDSTAAGTGPVLPALAEADLPPGRPYAWVAGESGTVRALRRHLVNERGFDRGAVMFTGYWRRGTTEEELLAAAAAGDES